MKRPKLLTLGHGYAAAALAARLEGWGVAGTTRSPEKAAAMREAGVVPVDWADREAVEAAVAAAGAVLVSLPPGEDGDPVLVRHWEALGRAAAAGRLKWIGYLSTTGVYGDRSGGWVDEDAALQPVNERSRRRMAAELAWLETGLPVHVFRLAGIYGPGRSALDRLRDGRARRIVKPGQVFSRIHRDDIAQALDASMRARLPGRVYNLADDEPAPPQDVISFAATLIGAPVPPEEDLEDVELSPMARSFWGESKRVCNRRMKEDLGVRLIHPDYRVGLRAILAGGG
jgi:nucleoside-diphosphate-sugar epimerase